MMACKHAPKSCITIARLKKNVKIFMVICWIYPQKLCFLLLVNIRVIFASHLFLSLCDISFVCPSVLKCLQARYSAKLFYTQAGCTLVALNPFQHLPDLYSLDMMKLYHCAPQPQVCASSQQPFTTVLMEGEGRPEQSSECFCPQEFKPHIFIVAEEAYRNIRDQLEPLNQSLVVSGESGAGKVNQQTNVIYSHLQASNTVWRYERSLFPHCLIFY